MDIINRNNKLNGTAFVMIALLSVLILKPLIADQGKKAQASRVWGITKGSEKIIIGESRTYHANNTITVAGDGETFVIEGEGTTGGEVHLTAENMITLRPGFSAQLGSHFTANISSSPLPKKNDEDISGSDMVEIPKEFDLLPNYPNPFNPNTTFEYALPEDVFVAFKIYNVRGQLVKTLVDAHETAGYKSVVWDGCDDLGRKVSSGIYIYNLKAGKYQKVNRMTLLK